MERQGNYYQPQKAINWPKEFLPGFTDNYASNEVYTKTNTPEELWQFLEDGGMWTKYSDAITDFKPIEQESYKLKLGTKFSCKKYGTSLKCEVIELQKPFGQVEGRISWKMTADDPKTFECVQGWLLERYMDGRTRILTQESAKGSVAQKNKGNTVINMHQNWINGLIAHTKVNAGSLLSNLI